MALIIPTLMYHSVDQHSYDYLTVSTGQFARQIEHLASNYQVVTVRSICQFLRGEAQMPPRPVLITFDDGLKDNIDWALPVLERSQASAVFFIISSYLGADNSWDHKAPRIVPHMTDADVRALQGAGYEIGNHTLTHQRLSKLPDETLAREFNASHAFLTGLLDSPPVAFSYPYGDADDRSQALCRSLYPFGFATVRQGCFDWSVAPANIRRIYVSPEDSPAALDQKIACYLEQTQHG